MKWCKKGHNPENINYHIIDILWVKILLRDQELCVFNTITTTKYFSLGKGACQGDPISAFLLDYNYLYSAYADDTTFFLKDIISIKHMVDTFGFFHAFLD